MRVHLGGHLSWYDPQKRTWLELPEPGPVALLEVLRRLGIPPAEIAIATVNRHAVDLETSVAADGDTVEFFTAVGGG